MRLGDIVRQTWYVQVACVGGADGATTGFGDGDWVDRRLFVDDWCPLDNKMASGS